MDSIPTFRNQLLIAMPAMRDPQFTHTVTLVCQHDEEGAFGLTINRPTDLKLQALMQQLDIELEDEQLQKQLVLSGGPVQTEQGFVLHDSHHPWESTMRVADDLFITSSKDILVDIAKGQGPEYFLLVLGCSGWEAGQLEQEIKDNVWLTCPATHELIFTMPYPHRWRGAAATLGVDVNLLGVTAGHA
ncbi:YqgE/AlgH family protein [Thiofilum flexile]|uniref:YqgE/AlgH family protein n=1 Tax=Thiofilum flexile TaxID=125627 RepID=UPI00036C0B48|nr:YqgE/AlgH family protein [Thiofilum flexile]